MKSKFSTKLCEKLLKEIQDQYASSETSVSLEHLVQTFPKYSTEDITTALYYLEDEGCIINIRSRSDIPGLSRWDIELNFHGKTYLALKHEHHKECWLNRTIGAAGALVFYLLTEHLLPFFISWLRTL